MKTKNKNQSQKAYSSLVTSAVFWGLAPVFYKQGLLLVSITIFLAFRFGIGALYIFATERKKFIKLSVKVFAIVAAFAIFDALIVNLIYSYAIQRTSILHASIIQLAVPFFVYFFAAILLREKPHKVVIFGGLIAVMGLGIIVLANNSSAAAGASAVSFGDMVMLVSACVGAFSIVLGRKVLSSIKKLPSEQLGFMEYAISAVPLFVIIMVTGQWTTIASIQLQSWMWIFAAAIIAGAIPITLYYRAVKKLPAERLADMSFISPAVASFVGILFLGEQLSVGFILGTSLVLLGLLVGHKKIHPVLAAHKLGTGIDTLEKSFRIPQKAYQYITVETKKTFGM